MARGPGVRIGERFKPAGNSVFGRVGGEVFEVRDVLGGTDALPHAKLFNVANPTEHKLIAVNALWDPKLYLPVEARFIEPDERALD
jgi:hypothetical protein